MREGWIIYVKPVEITTPECFPWCAETINIDEDKNIAYGSTPNDAIGRLVGLLTKLGSATIREIHTQDENGETLYPAEG